MRATVADVMAAMEEVAPSHLAESWDNVGLQIGDPSAPVTKVHVALDGTPDVVASAIEDGAQVLITHHPLIFSGMKRLDLSTPLGKILAQSVTAPLAIYSAHTNLDSAPEGLNHAFAEMLGLKDLKPLVQAESQQHVKLAFFVPESHRDSVMEALWTSSAGTIGGYSCCSFASSGHGTYLPGGDSKPFAGEVGALSREPELRVEVSVTEAGLKHAVKALKAAHPYETLEYNVYPMAASAGSDARDVGLGRFGCFEKPIPLKEVVARIKEAMGMDLVKVAGDMDKTIESAALCTGSGSSLMKAFYGSGADLYISGELKYHDAQVVLERGGAMIDAGHFETEHFVCTHLSALLSREFAKMGVNIEVVPSRVERPVFSIE